MGNDEPNDQLHVTAKKTVELCADEPHRGVRCVLPRGHDGDHTFQTPSAGGTITWNARSTP